MTQPEELERIRSIYGASVALVAYDLTQNIKNIRTKQPRKATTSPWPQYFGTQLASLAEDTVGCLRVPQLWEAVSLWADGKLESYGIWKPERLDRVQMAFVRELSRRFDQLHLEGDPYLTARHVLATPRVLHLLCRLTGLEDNKAQEAVGILTAKAQTVAQNTENRFPRTFKAEDRQSARPLFMQKAHAESI